MIADNSSSSFSSSSTTTTTTTTTNPNPTITATTDASCSSFPRPAVLLCGDFNSFPSSSVYDYISTGVLHRTRLGASGGGWDGQADGKVGGGTNTDDRVRLLMDRNMGKLAKWLRVLGVNAAQWDGKRGDHESLFQRAQRENRLIVSFNRQLLRRRHCPPSLHIRYFINMYVYIYIYIWMACRCVCMYVCIGVCIYICMYVQTSVCM